MNKIVLIGRLSAQPELKTTTSGAFVLSFCIAVRRDFKNSEGTYDSDFIDCTAYNQTAEAISKFFNKGDRIALVGKLHTRKWEDKEGHKRKSVDVSVESFEFIDLKKTDAPQYAPAQEAHFEDVGDSDDLPF